MQTINVTYNIKLVKNDLLLLCLQINYHFAPQVQFTSYGLEKCMTIKKGVKID